MHAGAYFLGATLHTLPHVHTTSHSQTPYNSESFVTSDKTYYSI